MSRFFREIIIFSLTNVPDECRTGVIMKGSNTYKNKTLHTSNIKGYFCEIN